MKWPAIRAKENISCTPPRPDTGSMTTVSTAGERSNTVALRLLAMTVRVAWGYFFLSAWSIKSESRESPRQQSFTTRMERIGSVNFGFFGKRENQAYTGASAIHNAVSAYLKKRLRVFIGCAPTPGRGL